MAEFLNLEDFAGPIRAYKEIFDPLTESSDVELKQRYRFDQETIIWLTDLLRPELERNTGRSRALPAETQVLTALRYLASNAHQRVIADTLSIDQASVSRSIARFLDAMIGKMPDFIQFPVEEEARQSAQKGFYELHQFPNIVGCIDGTHVRILPPSNQADPLAYYNWKGYPSLNVQSVCDHQGKFTNVVACWPGSSHDSWILRQSELFEAFEAGQIQGILLGDAGYPCKPWLLTPYSNPTTEQQVRFNSALCGTRVLIENSFGRLKCCFAILHQEIRLVPTSKIMKVIGVCCMLHNLATDRKVPLLPNPDVDGLPQAAPQPAVEPYQGRLGNGNAYRDHFAQLIG